MAICFIQLEVWTLTFEICLSSVIPFQSQDDRHVDGAHHDHVGERVDDHRVDHGVAHGAKVECSDKTEFCDNANAQQSVHDSQHHYQRVEAVSHVLPASVRK